MIIKNRLLLIALAILFSSNLAQADDEGNTLGILAASKIAGACGILDSMIYFQKTTKMAGGDEFVSRFWAAEAARLGISMQEYSDQCDRAIIMYDKVWQSIESETQ